MKPGAYSLLVCYSVKHVYPLNFLHPPSTPTSKQSSRALSFQERSQSSFLNSAQIKYLSPSLPLPRASQAHQMILLLTPFLRLKTLPSFFFLFLTLCPIDQQILSAFSLKYVQDPNHFFYHFPNHFFYHFNSPHSGPSHCYLLLRSVSQVSEGSLCSLVPCPLQSFPHSSQRNPDLCSGASKALHPTQAKVKVLYDLIPLTSPQSFPPPLFLIPSASCIRAWALLFL